MFSRAINRSFRIAFLAIGATGNVDTSTARRILGGVIASGDVPCVCGS
jgi:hypothetical protein